MSKFKAGDRVKIVGRRGGYRSIPDFGTILGAKDNTGGAYIAFEPSYPDGLYFTSEELETDVELVTSKENKVARRTFKQLKDTFSVKKGALYQEDCEDGTQSYSLITPEHYKGSDRVKASYRDRTIIEKQPEWFVEVFKVEPEYMTKEELDRYKDFISGRKTPSKRRPYTKHPERIEAEEALSSLPVLETPATKNGRYHFEDMAVGDKFVVPKRYKQSAYNASYSWRMRNNRKRRFTVRDHTANTAIVERIK